MIKFKDRKSSYINRRRLNVKDVVRWPNGEIKELLVDISREEGPVTEVGTKLNSISLNNALNNALEFLFKQHFTLQNNLNVSWTQEEGYPKTVTFRIDTPQKVYGKVVIPSSYIIGTISSGANYLDVTIDETNALNGKYGYGTDQFEFFVEVYLDSSLSNYITRFKGIVNYFYTSTNPSD